MTEFQVGGVELVESSDRNHQHVGAVCLAQTGTKLKKSTVVADLRKSDGDRYFTLEDGEKAYLRVVSCPRCDDGDYLTTSPDDTKANNLLSLPSC